MLMSPTAVPLDSEEKEESAGAQDAVPRKPQGNAHSFDSDKTRTDEAVDKFLSDKEVSEGLSFVSINRVTPQPATTA